MASPPALRALTLTGLALALASSVGAETDVPYNGDPFAVSKSWDADLRPDPRVPRTSVGLPPTNASDPMWIQPFEEGPLPCGGTRHDVFDGTELVIETENYPSRPSRGEGCNWFFTVMPGVAVDLLCEQIQIPCAYNHFLRIRFDSGRNMRECTNSTSTIFLNQAIPIRDGQSGQYELRLRHTTRRQGNRGIGFRCVVRGNGGMMGPQPTQPPPPPPTNPPPPPPPPPAGSCGVTLPAGSRSSGKIINGNFADPNEYPWQAVVRAGNSFCGGTVISSRWVMTAGHCVVGRTASQLIVRTGCHNRPGDCDPDRFVNLVVLHENYSNILNDIALLRLSSPLTFNNRVQAICLPTVSTPAPGRTLTVSGWGLTADGGSISPTLKEATVNTLSDAGCIQVYGSAINSFAHLCATAGSGSTCSGDSGSFVGSMRNGM